MGGKNIQKLSGQKPFQFLLLVFAFFLLGKLKSIIPPKQKNRERIIIPSYEFQREKRNVGAEQMNASLLMSSFMSSPLWGIQPYVTNTQWGMTHLLTVKL